MRIIRIICLLGIISSLLIGCSKHKHVTLQGYIEGQFIYLASNASGNLKSLLIYRGNRVATHQTLFALDPEPETDDLQQAKANLMAQQENLVNVIQGQRATIIAGIIAQREKATADFTYAQQTLKRYEKLYAEAAISKDQLDQAVADFNAKKQLVGQYEANLSEAKLGSREHIIMAQQATVDAAIATVKKLEWQLQQKTIAAPKAGQIFDTFFKEGEYVPAGQPVAALLTPDNIKLIFYVPEPLLSQLKIGSTVQFNCDGCKMRQARVDYISPQAEYTPPIIYSEQTRATLVYRVESSIAPQEAVEFHAGQPVDVYVDTGH